MHYTTIVSFWGMKAKGLSYFVYLWGGEALLSYTFYPKRFYVNPDDDNYCITVCVFLLILFWKKAFSSSNQ